MGFRNKLIFSILIPLVFVFIAAVYSLNTTSVDNLRESFNQKAVNTLDSVQQQIVGVFSEAIKILEISTVISRMSEDELNDSRVMFENILQKVPQLVQLSALNINSEEWIKVNRFKRFQEKLSGDLYFYNQIYIQPILNNNTYIGNAGRHPGHVYPVSDIALPYRNLETGEPEGVIWGKVSFQQIRDVLEDYVPHEGLLFLYEKTGGKYESLTFADRSTGSDSEFDEIMPKLVSAETQSGTFKFVSGEHFTAIYKKFNIENIEYALVLVQPDRVIYSLADEVTTLNAVVLVSGLVIITAVIMLVTIALTAPLRRLSVTMLEKASTFKGGDALPSSVLKSKDEIGALLYAYDVFYEAIEYYSVELEQLNKNLEMKVQEKTQELSRLNDDLQAANEGLEVQVAKQVDEIRRKEHALLQQSKLASMGEMIGAIAHQWRQPLNSIALMVQDLEDASKFDELDDEYIAHTVSQVMQQVDYMSGTIDDFRNFFKPKSSVETFNVCHAINEVITIVKAQLENNNIKMDGPQCAESDYFCYGYLNEFKQVIINLVTNAKDALLADAKNNSKNECRISISIESGGGIIRIILEDTGPGVPLEYRDRIFDPYFTTKEEGKGTGIGLYMAKLIIESNMKGRLYCADGKSGAKFVIELNSCEEKGV